MPKTKYNISVHYGFALLIPVEADSIEEAIELGQDKAGKILQDTTLIHTWELDYADLVET